LAPPRSAPPAARIADGQDQRGSTTARGRPSGDNDVDARKAAPQGADRARVAGRAGALAPHATGRFSAICTPAGATGRACSVAARARLRQPGGRALMFLKDNWPMLSV